MALIFCRHGQTEFNLEDRFQGVSDSPLTPKGVSQAQRINYFLKENYKIKKFFISPAGRVRKTYEIISQGIDAELYVVPELREVCYGEWEGVARKDIDSDLLEEREKKRFSYKHPGYYQNIPGESYKDVYFRVKPFLDKVCKKSDDICVISHNGVIISVLKYFYYLDDSEVNKIRVQNDTLVIVQVKSSGPDVNIIHV